MIGPLLVAGLLAAAPAERPLVEAARRGDTRAVEVLLAAGADVNAATRTGETALLAAAARGHEEIAARLLDAGAEVDVRDRALGTPLDAAERAGHQGVARRLRARGARGSGKSVGDTVCVRLWAGEGYCAVVEQVAAARFDLRLTRLEGCRDGCAAHRECSAGRPVGGGGGGVAVGDILRVPSACLTHTGVDPAR